MGHHSPRAGGSVIMYNKKLLEEFRKYGAVTCSVCHKRKRKDWNIYSNNTMCSPECAKKMIDKLCAKAYNEML